MKTGTFIALVEGYPTTSSIRTLRWQKLGFDQSIEVFIVDYRGGSTHLLGMVEAYVINLMGHCVVILSGDELFFLAILEAVQRSAQRAWN